MVSDNKSNEETHRSWRPGPLFWVFLSIVAALLLGYFIFFRSDEQQHQVVVTNLRDEDLVLQVDGEAGSADNRFPESFNADEIIYIQAGGDGTFSVKKDDFPIFLRVMSGYQRLDLFWKQIPYRQMADADFRLTIGDNVKVGETDACFGTDFRCVENREKPLAPASATATASTIVSATATARAIQRDPRCVEADAVAQVITEGLTVSGGGSLRHAQAVRSADFESAWFVAAEIDGPGLEGDGEIGLWVTNAIDGSGLIYSVNRLARDFSSWGHSDWTDARFSLGDDGAAEAIDCVD